MNGNLKYYLINVTLNDKIVQSLETNETNYNVIGLKKFTTYGFTVSAKNQAGVGPGSVRIFNKTLADCKLINIILDISFKIPDNYINTLIY